ncbi:netrin receptor UNC5B [Trichonephila clavipes]|nr:netrin receptor UNC5B [Trichonephila clavipes]
MISEEVFIPNLQIYGGLLPDPFPTDDGDTSGHPVFLEEPRDTYVLRSRPATLSCKVRNALQLYFVCNDKPVHHRHHSQQEFVDPQTGVRHLEVSVDVNRKEVEEFFGLDGYGCSCIAWSSSGTSKSRRAHVKIASQWLRYPTMAGCHEFDQVPLKTRRVGQRCTLNLSRAETSSRWCGVVVRRGVPAQVSSTSLDHGSKLRGPSPKASCS